MTRFSAALALLVLLGAPLAHAAPEWTEGKNYFPIQPVQRTSVPAGKVEVMEVFSYGCPACAQFTPVAQKPRRSLPANASMVYLPASFIPSEDWPMFQRAFCTAQALGVADKTHDAIFDAVWNTRELAISDPKTNRPRSPLPTIEDAARVYQRLTGIPAEKFTATAKSFAIDVKMKADDAFVRASHVDQTPTLIVNGKYRITVGSAGGEDKLIELVKWLVARESR
jgi:protein dithiol oxidoreductase (disulfide-forming)